MARRLNKELYDLQTNPLDFCSAGPVGDDIMHWNALVMGPQDTPYSGGIFSIDIKFAAEYPFKPPTVKFITKIYHPNVNLSGGEICKDLINNNWGPTLNARYVLTTMRNLMIDRKLLHYIKHIMVYRVMLPELQLLVKLHKVVMQECLMVFIM